MIYHYNDVSLIEKVGIALGMAVFSSQGSGTRRAKLKRKDSATSSSSALSRSSRILGSNLSGIY
jgi:hypothetical protein